MFKGAVIRFKKELTKEKIKVKNEQKIENDNLVDEYLEEEEDPNVVPNNSK